jgi:hypothetical protein
MTIIFLIILSVIFLILAICWKLFRTAFKVGLFIVIPIFLIAVTSKSLIIDHNLNQDTFLDNARSILQPIFYFLD